MSTGDHIVCTACGAINRIPPDRAATAANCGTCHQPLFAGKPADVSGQMFERQLGKSSVPVLVDVWAPWCGPCLAMAPQYEAAARALEPAARFLKLNSDNEQAIASRLGIRGIPTMILFKDGRQVDRVSGAMSARQIEDWLHSR